MRRTSLKEKGITLIALVVTIIVLLILAGITISMAINNNGIIQRAKDASEVYAQAENNETNTLAKFAEYVDTLGETPPEVNSKKITEAGVKPSSQDATVVPLSTKGPTDLEDDQGNIVKVPKNFGVAYDSADNVCDGVVIEDADHNQYVWIPVDNGIKKSNGTDRVNISLIRSNFSGTTTTNAEDVINSYYYEYASNPEEKSYGNTKAKSLSSFINSVSRNKGYYIARYEAGINATKSQYEYANCSGSNSSMTYGTEANMVAKDGSVKPLAKSGLGVWNAVTQQEAATICQAMYNKARDGVESDLINSFAWDTAIDYIQKCGKSNYDSTQGKSKTDTSKPQTAGTNILNATNAVDQQCKIFDMAGNVYEWSTETYTSYNGSYPCVYRGGNYYNTFSTRYRDGFGTTTRDVSFGFRPLLYL